MTDSEGTTSARAESAAGSRDCLCGSIGKAFRAAAEVFGPPEAAARHFRNARKEVLLGIRELIDVRIENLSRSEKKGTRVVVE